MISIRAYDVSKKPKLKNILYDKYDNICIFKLSGLFAIKNFENILLFNKSNLKCTITILYTITNFKN